MLLIHVISLAAVATTAPQAHAQGMSAARAFVVALYDRYGHAEPDYLGRDGPSAFTPDLLRLIRQDQARAGRGYVGALDWDPICGCQDPDGLKLVGVVVEPTGSATARATARLQYPAGKPVVVRLYLAFSDGHWRVSDIHEDETPSLVGLLRHQRR